VTSAVRWLAVAAAWLGAWAGPAARGAPAAEASLSFEVVDRVGWRGGRAAEVPARVTERYRYDAATDTLEVVATFDRQGFCPLPPMMAVAVRHGFPVEFDAKPQEGGHVGVLGPLLGFADARSYAWRLKGLSKYVPGPAPPRRAATAPARDALRADLARGVEAVIAAGHLRPWLLLVNVPGSGANERGEVFWDNPGEVLYLLAEMARLDPEGAGRALLPYLRAERAAYPPEGVAAMPFTAGAAREVNPHADRLLADWQEKVLAHRTKAPVGAWNLYGLARFYDATGEAPTPEVMARCTAIVTAQLEHRDWATLYWARGHTPGFNAVHAVNQLFAGYAGYVRLARLARDEKAEAMGMALLARAAALRFAMGKYTQFLHETRQFNVEYGVLPRGMESKPGGWVIRVETEPAKYTIPADPAWWAKAHANSWIGELASWRWTAPIHNVRQVERLDETGVEVWEWGGVDCRGSGQKRDDAGQYWYKRTAVHLLPFRDLTPELGRFLRDHLRPECAAYVERVEENQPHWHTAYAEAILGAEQGFMLPTDSYSIFLACAWVLERSPAELERRIDVPFVPRGDLYHLHKLAASANDGGVAQRRK